MQMVLLTPPGTGEPSNPFAGMDGDFSRALAAGVYVPERQAYEPSDPHAYVRQDGVIERRIASSSGGWGAGTTVMTVNLAVLEAVIEDLWWHWWMDMHGDLYPGGPDTVPQGVELDPVRIQFQTGPNIYNRNNTKWGPSHDGSTGKLLFCGASSNNKNASIDPSQCAVLRDVVFYGDYDTNSRFYLPQVEWNAGISAFGNQNHDNVRFDICEHKVGQSVFDGYGAIKKGIGSPQVWTTPQGVGFHGGRLKFYDCKMTPVDGCGDFYSESDQHFATLWGVRFNGPWGLDMRTREAFRGQDDWKFFRAAQEHYLYNDELTGPAHGIAGNYFIGLENQRDYLLNSGPQEASPKRTMLQVENRPQMHGQPTTHGDLAIIDCHGKGIGERDGAYTFTVQGHGGDSEGGILYIEDCSSDGSDNSGTPLGPGVANQGLLVVHQGFSGGVQAGYGNFVEGRSRFRRAGDPAGHTYCADTVVIDGLTALNMSTNGRSCVSLPGCRTLDLRMFDLRGFSGGAQLALNSNGVQRGDLVTGEVLLGQLKDPDTLAPFVGSFSGYPGFAAGTKVEWAAHMNTWNSGSSPAGDNLYALTPAEMDVLPDLVEEVRLNRTTELGNGRYSISHPSWTHKAEPALPVVGFRDSITPKNHPNIPVGESGYCTLTMDADDGGWAGDTECLTRFAVALSGDATAFDVEYGDLDLGGLGLGNQWLPLPGLLTWAPVDRNGVWESVWTDGYSGVLGPDISGLGLDSSPDNAWKPMDIPLRVTPKEGLAPGSYSITLDVTGGGEVEFPKDSGTWVQMGSHPVDPGLFTFTYTQP